MYVSEILQKIRAENPNIIAFGGRPPVLGSALALWKSARPEYAVPEPKPEVPKFAFGKPSVPTLVSRRGRRSSLNGENDGFIWASSISILNGDSSGYTKCPYAII